jgi:type IV pilus assembly protein PilE
MRNKLKGFTLIELMITVVIVGILAAIAYPAYQNSVTQSRRADAQGALTQLNNAMERTFTENNTYMPGSTAPTLGTGAATPPHIFPSQAPLDGTTKYYDLSISAITANTYTLRATPIAGTAQANNGMIELTHTGIKRWDADNSGGFSAAENNWKQ